MIEPRLGSLKDEADPDLAPYLHMDPDQANNLLRKQFSFDEVNIEHGTNMIWYPRNRCARLE